MGYSRTQKPGPNEKAVVNLGAQESFGLTYVALSRVKSINGLGPKGDYSCSRILRTNQLAKKHEEREEIEAWLAGVQWNA